MELENLSLVADIGTVLAFLRPGEPEAWDSNGGSASNSRGQ